MKLHRNEMYKKWGITGFLVFAACSVFWIVFSNLSGFYGVINDLFSILSPILYGFLFAYLMNPIMKFTVKRMERILRKKSKWTEKRILAISKITGVVVSVIVFLLCVFALFALIVPNLIGSIADLLQQERLDAYYNKITNWANSFLAGTDVAKWIQSNLDKLLDVLVDTLKKIDIAAIIAGLTSSVYSIVMTVFDIFIGIVAAVYLLIYKEKLCAQAKKSTVAFLSAKHADRILEITRRTNRIFGGYVIGKIIDAIFVGVITYITLLILGMPFAPLISVIVGITNIIPFFGPFIGAVPSALLLLVENPIDALYFIIFVIIMQMIDGNIIENRILGEKLGISDFWVLVSILLFGGIFGFGGMLLGVPIFAVLYTIIADGVNKCLKRKHYPTSTDEYYTLQCVSELPVEAPQSYSFVSVEPAYDLKAEPEEELDDYDEE